MEIILLSLFSNRVIEGNRSLIFLSCRKQGFRAGYQQAKLVRSR